VEEGSKMSHEKEDDYTLMPNPEHKFTHEDHPLIEEFYKHLLSEFGNEAEDYNESLKKSVELYLHHLGLRRAKKEDLRRWMQLNVLDLDENFRDENSHILTSKDGDISELQYKKLICNITIHSLAWAGHIHIDSKNNITMSKEGEKFLERMGE
jgi:hypothetical protein